MNNINAIENGPLIETTYAHAHIHTHLCIHTYAYTQIARHKRTYCISNTLYVGMYSGIWVFACVYTSVCVLGFK